MEEKIFTVYAESNDMTFIMKETLNIEEDIKTLEVVGFYHGEPNDEYTQINIGFLRSEF